MIYFLLPPSEGKTAGGSDQEQSLSFPFDLPVSIAAGASEKELKCKGARYEEGISLNKGILTSSVLPAIQRYSGVMYKALGVETMSEKSKKYVDSHALIISGMYGIVTPSDLIGNYKLPIDTKGLKNHWGDSITKVLIEGAKDSDATIVDLLSGTYKKYIDKKKIEAAGVPYIVVKFLKQDGSTYTHGVKKVKGAVLRGRCEKGVESIQELGGEMKEGVLEEGVLEIVI